MMHDFIKVPEVVRMKPGALSRVGLYLARPNLRRVFLVWSHGLVPEFVDTLRQSTADAGVELLGQCEVTEASVEAGIQMFGDLPLGYTGDRRIWGGKALDVGKYLASLSGLNYFAVPTSLSNDGFCSLSSAKTKSVNSHTGSQPEANGSERSANSSVNRSFSLLRS
jgi:glycerol-1-phosphate dehydrogenase [NAD(P)+]